jgi:hypothetical protein
MHEEKGVPGNKDLLEMESKVRLFRESLALKGVNATYEVPSIYTTKKIGCASHS